LEDGRREKAAGPSSVFLVEVIGENRNLLVRDGCFQDRFNVWDVPVNGLPLIN
jgi:hypothetical protein